jgi:hypothetical protein
MGDRGPCPACGREVRGADLVEVEEQHPQPEGELKRRVVLRCRHCFDKPPGPVETQHPAL